MILTGMMTCATMVSEAQQVEGRVIDAARMPIEAATVVLQARDSSFVGATVTDSLGYFRFEQSPDCYRLIFQHILYRTVEKEGCGADAGEVELAAQDYALDEVVVRGERPLVKVEKGALSYDAAVLAERTTATTAFEALTRVPGIREQENDVILSGAGDVNLLINGKPSGMNREQLIMLLKSLPASEVGQIEVMYNTYNAQIQKSTFQNEMSKNNQRRLLSRITHESLLLLFYVFNSNLTSSSPASSFRVLSILFSYMCTLPNVRVMRFMRRSIIRDIRYRW